jgi:hypothetical protein
VSALWHRNISRLAILGIEGSWLYALLCLLNEKIADGCLTTPWLLFPYLLAFVFNKLLLQLKWRKPYTYLANGLVCIASILLLTKFQLYGDFSLLGSSWLSLSLHSLSQVFYSIEPELLILLASIGLWWLGRRAARLKIDPDASIAEFQFGLVALLIILFITSQTGLHLVSSTPSIIAFFLFSLLGMSLSHASSGSDNPPLFRRYWFAITVISIGVIIALGFLVDSIVDENLVQLLLIPFKWIWGLFMQAMDFLASLFGNPPPPAETPPPVAAPSTGGGDEFMPELIPRTLRDVLRLVSFSFMLGMIVFALWRMSSDLAKWLRRKLTTTQGVEVESLPSGFKADLLALLKRIMAKLHGLMHIFHRQKSKKPLPRETASVRDIYRQFLRWTARKGCPMKPHQTPSEHLRTMEHLLPAAQDDLRFITQQYLHARYSPSPPGDSVLNQLTQAWRRLKRIRFQPSPEQGYQHSGGNLI